MANSPIKILFFSDSHLGFDFPIRPRVEMRRRGDDFFSNYHHILEFAKTEKVDLIVHGGDMFTNSRVPPLIIEKAYEPLVNVANCGIPVYIVPGNHERSKLPVHLWLAYHNIHVFDYPKTFYFKKGEFKIGLSGFPFARKVRAKIQSLLQQTRYFESKANVNFLCLHQTIEGAKVGPKDFTFRVGPDNILGSEIPNKFNLVLSGHIHRNQQLTHGLDGRPLSAPVIYSGSIERTSFAECFEKKYFVVIKIDPSQRAPMPIVEFHQLPTRPMLKIEIPTQNKSLEEVKIFLQDRLSVISKSSIVRINFSGPHMEKYQLFFSAKHLRNLAPPTINISLAYQWKNTDKYSDRSSRIAQGNI